MGLDTMNPATQVAIPIRTINTTKVLNISHCEYYSTVAASGTTFSLQDEIVCNPGLSTSFPWLSNIAVNYTKYKFKELYLEYVPSCPTSTPGTIYFGFDPDVLSSGPEGTSDMIQYKVNLQGSVFLNHRVKVPREILETKLFTRAINENVSDADLKTYDIGQFYVVTDQTTANTALGFLKLCYSVQFFDPQPRSDAYAGQAALWTGTAANPLNVQVVNALINQVPSYTTAGVISFKSKGTYLLNAFNSTGATTSIGTQTGGVAVTSGNAAAGNASSDIYAYLTVTGPGTITVGSNGTTVVMLTKVA